MVTALELATAVAVAMAAVNGPGGEAEGDRPEVEIERCAASKSFAIKKKSSFFLCVARTETQGTWTVARRARRAPALDVSTSTIHDRIKLRLNLSALVSADAV